MNNCIKVGALFFHTVNARGGESHILHLRMLCKAAKALPTSAVVSFIPLHCAKAEMNPGLVPAEPIEVQHWELLLGTCHLINS